MKRKRKPLLIHAYFAGEYQNTEYCESAKQAKAWLKGAGVVSRINELTHIGKDSITYTKYPYVYEVEEAVEEDMSKVYVDGKKYIPIADYAKKYKISKNTVVKQFYAKKINGTNVGKERYIYIEDKSMKVKPKKRRQNENRRCVDI